MVTKVILADDHAVMRDGLRSILNAQKDIAVVGDAGDGHKAVALARDLKPDIAIVDIAMPGLNGIDAARQIREVSPNTKVVILSMHATAEYIFRAFEAGAMGYVLKESAGFEVVDAIRCVCEGKRYLSLRVSSTVLDDYLRRRASADGHGPLDSLSPREREVLQLVVEGKTSKEIARVVHISQKTVDTYRHRVMQKLGVRGVAGLMRFALEHGIAPS